MFAKTQVLPRNRAARQRNIARTVALLPSVSEMAARLEDVFALATEDEHLAGKRWYPEAFGIANAVGALLLERAEDGTLGTLRRSEALRSDPRGQWCDAGAGVVAALSPQCSWDENIRRALGYAEGDDIGGLGDGLGKAVRIAAGEHPLDVLGGRKVRSFYRNISGHGGHVTIDRHAVAIVWGRPLTDREIKILERCGAYTYIAAVYRAVARKHGIAPSTLQAITWVTWRRLKNPDLGDF